MTDLEIVCEIAFDWAGEYGFSDPDTAKEIWDAATRLCPHLEPKPTEQDLKYETRGRR